MLVILELDSGLQSTPPTPPPGEGMGYSLSQERHPRAIRHPSARCIPMMSDVCSKTWRGRKLEKAVTNNTNIHVRFGEVCATDSETVQRQNLNFQVNPLLVPHFLPPPISGGGEVVDV